MPTSTKKSPVETETSHEEANAGKSQDPKVGIHHLSVRIDPNSFTDEGEGVITFPGGLEITNGDRQRNGTQYDIESMDITEFNGTITADHWDALEQIVGKATGSLVKAGNRVLLPGVQFAVRESAAGLLAYNLMRGGYLKDWSIETFGPWPDDEGIYYKAKLYGLSVVVHGNNRSATINQVVTNSLQEAKANGLDTKDVEDALGIVEKKPQTEDNQINKDNEEMSYKTIKNSRDFAVKLSYKNAAGDTVENELAPGATTDVSEDQAEAVEKQINQAQAPQPDVAELVKEAVNAAVKSLNDRIEKAETEAKNAFDAAAKEPGFKKDDAATSGLSGKSGNKIGEMPWQDRTALQVRSIYASLRGDREAGQVAHDINRFNFEELQKEGVISNAVDLPDLGNFVIPRQMITEIKEQPSNYRPLLDLFSFDETMSLETAWIKGTGEINMQDVDMDDNDNNADLKPISTPTFATDTTRLYEFAAVTPVKASAIRFAASDLVQHLTKLYKRAYDRVLARSIIGRLENAVDANGNSVPYNYSSAAGGDVEAVITLVTALSLVAEHSSNGAFVMTEASRLHLVAMAMRAGTNGPLAGLFTSDPQGVRFLNKPYAIVPSDLMPSLNTAATKSWSFEETSTVVNHGILLADPTDFVGKVSGGLNFQVSDVASYEEGGATKSAYQRDELLFRGYGYRASGLYFDENVSGVSAPGIS